MRLRPGTPVFSLGGGRARVGLSRPLTLTGLDDGQQRMLALLERGGVPGPSGDAALIDRLRSHGMLESPPPGRRPGARAPSAVVRLHDAGPLGWRVAVAAARAGHAVAVADRRPVRATDPYPLALLGRPGAEAMARALAEAAPGCRVASPDSPADIDVAVAAGAADPAQTLDWVARDAPHLVVAVEDERIEVGAVVEPGLTPCERCRWLRRAEDDPDWPTVALQLLGRPRRAAPPPDAAAAVAGGLAAAAVLGWLAGPRRGARDDARERTGSTGWSVAMDSAPGGGPLVAPVPVLAHPECGCGAAGEPGDELAARRAAFPVLPA